MPTSQAYRNALTALAFEIGLDAPALIWSEELDIDGICVAFSPRACADGEAIQMACKWGSLPPHPPLALLRLLLQADTLGGVTAGATIGLQHAADDLVLCIAHPLDTPPPALARACRSLTETAAVWTAALSASLAQASAEPMS